MNSFQKFFFCGIAGFMIFVVIMMINYIPEHNRLMNECELKGGVYMETVRGYACVKPMP